MLLTYLILILYIQSYKVKAAEIEVDIQVKILLDQYDIAGDRVLTFNEFSVYINERE